MNLDTLTVRLTAMGLPKVEEVLARAKPATILKPTGQIDPASASSRIGGLPLLSRGITWPRVNDRPLSLVAQVRLDPLHGATTVLGLPANGLLSFFYDIEGQPWGFDPADRGSFAVVYSEDPDACTATPFPDDLGADWLVPATGLNPEPTVTLPSPGSDDFPSDALNEDEREDWFDAFDLLAEELGWGRWPLLGGHPHLIQGDMAVECEIVAHAGVSTGDARAYRDPRLAEWTTGAREWMHLFQIASDEDVGLMFGDLGCLYFWIRKDDLAARRFNAAWTILQCF